MPLPTSADTAEAPAHADANDAAEATEFDATPDDTGDAIDDVADSVDDVADSADAVTDASDAATCVPGTYSCVGTSRRVCDPGGTSTTVVATCATPELCAASSDGSCRAPACSSGAKMCSGKNALVCNAGRTGYDTSACAIDCAAGSCVSVVALASAAAARHFCALLTDGTVRCWGIAPEAGATPAPLTGISSAVQVAVAYDATGVRLTDGTIRMVGGPDSKGLTTPIAGVTSALDFALSQSHGCFTSASGVHCWGYGSFGKLGNGTTSNVSLPSFTTVSGVVPTGPLALGSENSFAVVTGGARGWGLNDKGQLGVGDYADRHSPTATFSGALQISAGPFFTCARTSSGVVCSGANDTGQLGNGSTVSSASPVPVASVGATVDVAVGGAHACAILADKTVRCWGVNSYGQLGNGTTTASSTPVTVAGISAKDVACSEATTCALLTDGITVKCWGEAQAIGTTGGSSSTPVTVAF